MAEISGGSVVFSLDLDTTQATQATKQFVGETKKATTASSEFADTLKDSVGGALSQTLGPEFAAAQKGLLALSKDLKAFSASATASAKSTQAAAAGTKALSGATLLANKALQAFKIALASTGIGLIVVALGSLIAALTTTQRGLDSVNKVTRLLSTLFGRLLGVAQELGQDLIDLFSNPKQALQDFANLIRDNVVNRFEGLLNLLPALGEAIGLLFSGKFAEAGTVAANAVAQVALGVTDLTGKLDDATRQAAEFFGEVLQDSQTLANLDKQIEEATIEFTKQKGVLEEIRANNALIAADANKNEAQRAKAAQQAIDAVNQLSELEQDVVRLKIERLKLEQEQNDTLRTGAGSLQELAELESELNKIRATAANAQKELQGQLNAANKQAADQRKKEDEDRAKRLDDLLKLAEETAQKEFEAELQLALRKIQLEEEGAKLAAKIRFSLSKQTEDDKRNLEDSLQQITIDSLEKQIGAVEEYAVVLGFTEDEIAAKKIELENLKVDAVINANQRILDDNAKTAEKTKEQDEKALGQRKQLLEQLVSESVAFTNALFDFQTQRQNNEIAQIEDLREKELISEEQAAQKIAEIRRRQAVAEKAQGLFNVAINTAQAISRLLATFGLPTAIPLIALTSAQAAVQAAAISAQPIPQFAEGTLNAPGGLALVGEEGPEYVRLPKGSQVMPNPQTVLFDQIMQGSIDPASLISGIDFKGGQVYDDKNMRKLSEKSLRASGVMVQELRGLRRDLGVLIPEKYRR